MYQQGEIGQTVPPAGAAGPQPQGVPVAQGFPQPQGVSQPQGVPQAPMAQAAPQPQQSFEGPVYAQVPVGAQSHDWMAPQQEWRMIVTTTPGLAGLRVIRYLGVVAAEVVLGTSLTKDISAQMKGFVGGRSEAYEREVRHARQQATQDMVEIATQMQAQAIIGTSFDYTSINGLVMVTATGTAVQVEVER